MSVSKAVFAFLALCALTMLVACGGNGNSISKPVAPPSGAFSNSNLNGTYVFSLSGTDEGGASYVMAGTLTANGSGGITSANIDLNDSGNTPVVGATITNGTYNITTDGRGVIKVTTNVSGLPSLEFDVVLTNTFHGLISELDAFASGSGTLDQQTAGATPAGAYAFSLAGLSGSSSVWATAGNFTLTGTSVAGLDDLNEGGLLSYANQTLSGSLALNSSAGPATTLTTTPQGGGSASFNGLFDTFAIDSTHLKLIEMDTTATLSGDAFSQDSTALPAGNLAFTLQGASSSGTPLAIGGLMTNTAGAVSGTEDYNDGGNLSSATNPATFTAAFTAGGTGRFTLGGFAAGTFVGGSTYAAYPSSGGLLLLEIDSTGVTTGAAYTQSPNATLAASEGYGLNLTGINFTGGGTGSVEVDDIAQFDATSSAVTGIIDENCAPCSGDGIGPVIGLALSSGTYQTVGSGGRYGLSAAAGTLEGGFNLTLYAVDGTTFPFIEVDGNQVSTGVIVLQNVSATTPAIARSHSMFVPQHLVVPHIARQKNK